MDEYDPESVDIGYDHERQRARTELDNVRVGEESDNEAAQRTHPGFSIQCNRCESKSVALINESERGYYPGEGYSEWHLACRQCGQSLEMPWGGFK